MKAQHSIRVAAAGIAFFVALMMTAQGFAHYLWKGALPAAMPLKMLVFILPVAAVTAIGVHTFLQAAVVRRVRALSEALARTPNIDEWTPIEPDGRNDAWHELIKAVNALFANASDHRRRILDEREQMLRALELQTEEMRKFATAVERSPDAVIITSVDGKIEYVNRRFTELTGLVRDEAFTSEPGAVTLGPMSSEARAEVEQMLAIGKEWRGIIKNERKSGEVYWEAAVVAPMKAFGGPVTHHIWIKEDITEQKRQEEALALSEQRVALASQGANDGLWDWDLATDTITYTLRWKNLLGYAEDEIADKISEWFDKIHPEDLKEVREKIEQHLRGETYHFEDEYRMRHKDGSYRWVLCRGVAVTDEHGTPYRFAGSQSDITARKEAEVRLFHDASHDTLTGLPNRALFLNRLGGAIRMLRRNPQTRFAVLFIDLDRFKPINDTLGHKAGDELLVEVGRRLRLCLRDHDLVGRLGGDEFAILLEHLDNGDVPVRVAERIQRELSASVVLDGHDISISASIGIALSAEGYDNPDDLLRDADIAMYRAKSDGKARFAIFDEKLHEIAVESLQLEHDLRLACERDEFVVRFNPVVALDSSEVVGADVEVWWEHPERGLLPHDIFAGIAEKRALSPGIFRTTLESVCRDWPWRDEGERKWACLSVSAKTLAQYDFVSVLRAIIEDHEIPADRLVLAISESTVLQAPELVIERLGRLRDLGVRLCLDQFGAGQATIAHLHRLPFQAVKLHREVVQNLPSDDHAAKFAGTLVRLAHDLNLTVSAETVDTADQAARLQALGCDYGVGTYLRAETNCAAYNQDSALT